MKQWITGVAIVALTVGAAACSGNNLTAPDKITSIGAQPNYATSGSGVLGTREATVVNGITTNQNNFSSSADGDFVTFAAVSSESMIELSRLAANNGDAPEVKDFAAQLVQDYRAALNELRNSPEGASVSSQVSLDSGHQTLFNGLSQMSGSEFDRVYMTIVVEDLETAMSRFDQHGSSGSDAMQSYSNERQEHFSTEYSEARDIARRVGVPLSSVQAVR